MNRNINAELLAFISKFDTLSPEEIEIIAENITVRTYSKGSLLIKATEINKYCYFVLRGCLRQYRIIEGTEKTIQFFTEEQAVILFNSYANQSVADSYVACLEDSMLIVGEPNSETIMYQKFPKLEQITRSMMEQDFGKIQTDFANFISSSPEERYQNLLKNRPYLLQRVPQHQLASYLGVTPESLSRIRKRLAKAK